MSYKLKNVSDYRQSIVLGGKRVLLQPDDVFESDREMKYVWLERVPDETPVTVGHGGRPTNLSSIQEKLQELETNKSQAAVAGAEEIQAIAHAVEEVRQEIESNTEKTAASLNESIRDLTAKVEGLAGELDRNNKKTERRLEMMKGAIMTLQEDVYGIEFDEAGRVKEPDAEKSP